MSDQVKAISAILGIIIMILGVVIYLSAGMVPLDVYSSWTMILPILCAVIGGVLIAFGYFRVAPRFMPFNIALASFEILLGMWILARAIDAPRFQDDFDRNGILTGLFVIAMGIVIFLLPRAPDSDPTAN